MITNWITRRWAALESSSGLAEDERAPVELSLVATCVLLSQDRGIGYSAIVLGIAGLVYSPARRSGAFWLLMAALLAWSNVENWWIVDNHKYLINYWVLAVGLSFWTASPAKTIASNARMLIGLAMLLAVVQKLISGDYLDGTFFHFLLVQGHPRIRWLPEWLGMSSEAIEQNYAAMEEMFRRYDSATTVLQLRDTPGIYWGAQAITWWTQGIEILVAATFLAPARFALSKWRDVALLAFLFTTYAVAQVVLFGWVLTAMGMSQVDPKSRGVRLMYVLAFLAIVTYTVPLQIFPWTAR